MSETSYRLGDGTVVTVEFEPGPGFHPAAKSDVLTNLSDSLEPVVRGAKVVLDKVRQVEPDELQVKFGVKANGSANWLIARAATEANFEVTLTWRASKGGK